MKKRVLVALLSLTMIFGSLQCPSINAYADELADAFVDVTDVDVETEEVIDEEVLTTEEDILGDTSVKLEERTSVWQKLSAFIKSFEKDEDKEIVVSFEEDDSFVLVAQKDDEKIELIIGEDDKECVVIYSNNDFSMSGIQDIATLEDKLNFQAQSVSEDDIAKYEIDANDLFVNAMAQWNNELTESGLAMADLGFVSWEENETMIEGDIADEVLEAVEVVEDDTIDTLEEAIVEVSEDDEAQEEIISVDEEELELLEDNVADSDLSDEEVEEADVVEEELDEEALNSLLSTPAVEKVEVNATEITLKVGEEQQLLAKYYPENAKPTVTWSLNASYAQYISVDSNGLVRAIKPTGTNDVCVTYKVQSGSNLPIIKYIYVHVLANDYTITGYTRDEDGNYVAHNSPEGYVVIDNDGIWAKGFRQSFYTYTGMAVTQELEIYCRGELLTEKKDYTLSYKNNVNACTDPTSLNAPSVTITMKGQYSGKKTLYYSIAPAPISSALISNNDAILSFTGKAQKVMPVLTFNGKKLVNNKDYIVEFTTSDFVGNNTSNTPVYATITGKGNFQDYSYNYYGYEIVQACNNVSKATISCKSSFEYNDISQSIYGNDKYLLTAIDMKIKMPGSKVYESVVDNLNVTYNVIRPTGNNNVVTVRIEGVGPFNGAIIKTFKIVAGYKFGALNSVVGFDDEILYRTDTNKNMQTGVKLLYDGHLLTEGVDYVAEQLNYQKVGTAKMVFKGIGKFSGTFTKTFKIVNTGSFSYTFDSPVNYVQGGTTTKLTVQCNADTLVENTDYVIKYKNNNKEGTASFTIVGKGNYAKIPSVTDNFDINRTNIDTCTVTIPDKAYTGKVNSYKSTPTITAPNGKNLVAGKDYDKAYVYKYNHYDESSHAEYNNPAAGNLVNVVITGIGNYKGTVTGTYRIYEKTNSIAGFYIDVADKVYTGKAIEIDVSSDVTLYINAKDYKAKTNAVANPENYIKVVSYKNNINSGKATVVFGPIYSTTNGYGGLKTCTFKINKKNYDSAKPVSSVELNNTKLTLTSTTGPDSGYLIATVHPLTASNQNIAWTSSNPKAVDINSTYGNYCYFDAKGPGTSVITATTQDGKKVAKCTVTSVWKAIDKVNVNPAILNMTTNDVQYLTTTIMPFDAYIGGYTGTWKSSDTSVVTVDTYAGDVKAVGPGDAIVSYTINSKVGQCKIHVDGPKPVEKIVLNENYLNMAKNDTKQLTYLLLPASGYSSSLTWSSGNPSVATVSPGGLIKAISAGTAIITAKNDAGKSASCIVKVEGTVSPFGYNITDSSDIHSYGGASPNDSINDNQNIKKTMIYVGNKLDVPNSNRVVYIPDGVFNIGSTFSEPALYIDKINNTLTVNMTNKAVLKNSSSTVNTTFGKIQYSKDVTIKGGTIDGNKSIAGSNSNECLGLFIDNSTNITFDGVKFINISGDAINIWNNTTANSNVVFRNCIFSGNTKDHVRINGAVDVTFENCGFFDAGENAVAFVPDDSNKVTAKDIKFKNCVFNGNAQNDVYVVKGNVTNIDNISFDGCSFGGNVTFKAGTNITFTNTKNKPLKYVAPTGSTIFPD